MKTKLVTAPATEPMTLTEIKEHLHLDSVSFADDIAETQDLVSASHGVAAHTGVGVDVLGHRALVIVNMGAIAGAETVTVKIQEADADLVYTDWGSAFAVFNAANSSVASEMEYTGVKQYIRTHSTVVGGAVEFGTLILEREPPTAEDNFLTAIRLASKNYLERVLGRRLITQTWDYFLDEWPEGDEIELPYPPLQHYAVTTVAGENVTFAAAGKTMTSAGTPFTVAQLPIGRQFIVSGSTSNDGVFTVTNISTSVITVSETVANEGPTASVTFETTILKYTNSAGTITEPWGIANYIVDDDSEPGRIVLEYGYSWPSVTLYPSNPIRVRYECGYGDAASDIPGAIIHAMKLLISDMYENREVAIIGAAIWGLLKTVDNLIADYVDHTWTL